MAACKNNCNGIEILCYEPWIDGYFRHMRRDKVATTKIMVCTFDWKQNNGYLGNKITVMGVHSHHHTMNMKLSNTEQQEWWDKLREYIDKYDVRLLVGDLNM